MTREEAIEILEKHHMWTGEPQELIEVRKENEALNMAIASLKTDEAYQLEYENRDFVEIPKGMTNGEVMNLILRKTFPRMIFIRGINEWNKTKSIVYAEEWENAPYKAEKPETCKGCLEPCIMYEPDMRACKKKVTER